MIDSKDLLADKLIRHFHLARTQTANIIKKAILVDSLRG